VSARDELLDRTISWFAEHGIGDTSMRAAADAAMQDVADLLRAASAPDGSR
jgi:hypothetical protein